ncbi:MAG: hypothetical protein C5B51_32500 [Terriglobia bacterium]|nr:MAG: hypothetical protein C5B51_32500 [Terriglobia bacterium]
MTVSRIAILLAGTMVAPVFGATTIIFDVPGAVNTYPQAINTNGDIAGYYTLADSGACHGFLRTSAGIITTFDVAGAVCTLTNGINDSGAIAGVWNGSDFVSHGFIRSSSGTITTFDPPGAVTTNVAYLSNNGSTGGAYNTSQAGPITGYIRSSDGSFTTFNAPSGFSLQSVNAISATGDVAGTLKNTALNSFVTYLFVRHSDGSFVTQNFDPIPGGTKKYTIDVVSGINSFDQVVGTNQTQVGFPRVISINEPFVWANGTVTPFDTSQGTTLAVGINDGGEIVGVQLNPSNTTYTGFVRATNGTITTFQVGSVSTQPVAINNSGIICGNTITSTSNPNHEGFLLMP